MAPEQAAADPNTDHRADIYAFGVLAYEMLNGEPPFTGKTPQAVLAAHLTEAPAPVTRRRSSVPAPLAELVMRCLEKKPADRWQSAGEMVTRLEAMGTPSGGMEPTRSMAASDAGKGGSMGRWALTVGLAAVVGVGAWMALRPEAGPALDPGLVAVLPFRVNTTGADLGYLREGMVDLMATYLTGERGTARSVEPASVIADWQKRSGGNGADLAEAESEALARGLGAGMLMSGSIVGEESRLVIRASLAEVGFRGKAYQASVEGPAGEINRLLGQLVGQLLTLSAGMTVEESRGVLTNSLPALRAYLSGQAEYRRGAYAEAVNRFTEALQADSSFGLAGLGLVSASGWTRTAAPGVFSLAGRAAWNSRVDLGPKDRAVILAMLGPNGTEPSQAHFAPNFKRGSRPRR
jgi:serine/threonine-protein kinase